MKTLIAVVCALVASLAFNYATYLQKKVLGTLPEVKLKLSRDVVRSFIRNRTWVASVAFVAGGSALYALSATIAPISIVQPVMACGVALLAYLAIRDLGERPRRIDLVAIGLSILGVILIGVSLIEGFPGDVRHSAGSLWLITAGVVALAVAVPLLMRGSEGTRAAGLGISCGLLYGCSAVFAKLMLVDWSGRWHSDGAAVFFLSVFFVAWALLIAPAFIILQAALQKGMAIVVAPIMASLSALVPIFMGMLALHEKMPENAALAAVRFAGFALAITSTVILSRRAEKAGEFAAEDRRAPGAGVGPAIAGAPDGIVAGAPVEGGSDA